MCYKAIFLLRVYLYLIFLGLWTATQTKFMYNVNLTTITLKYGINKNHYHIPDVTPSYDSSIRPSIYDKNRMIAVMKSALITKGWLQLWLFKCVSTEIDCDVKSDYMWMKGGIRFTCGGQSVEPRDISDPELGEWLRLGWENLTHWCSFRDSDGVSQRYFIKGHPHAMCLEYQRRGFKF